MKTRMSVIQTRCVLTLKDPISAAVKGDILEMVKAAQVNY